MLRDDSIQSHTRAAIARIGFIQIIEPLRKPSPAIVRKRSASKSGLDLRREASGDHP
jgi:hypothetical protein